MSAGNNEIDALLMDSLQQLNAEFQHREVRLTRLCNECVTSFEQQSQELANRQMALMRQSSALSERYEVVMKELARLSEVLAKLSNTQRR